MDVGGRSLLCAAADRNPKTLNSQLKDSQSATQRLAIRNPKTRNSQLKNSQFSIACGDNS